ncbi:OsmC family peroxiredoxin [Actinomadura sp. KC06]|uniref:OsmC family protein n=1 Tax=Actinomadura sp. KC06 TaxID=2530369 RepID=UPI00104CA5EF|nr:OsmC family protein [Actinomadura sp. KC06]TDD34945.1 OsmC family peroxiredoxin [Actinomadura sp. KC06]
MPTTHTYEVTVTWTGDPEKGFDGDHEVHAPGVPVIPGAADPAFGGDAGRWNPEQTLTAALAQCHMLLYLYLCEQAGISVLAYEDNPKGTMTVSPSGGQFTGVVLRPEVTIGSEASTEIAERLHTDAHKMCFIANSVNFPVTHAPTIRRGPAAAQ